jgi:hypothetical protein
MDRSLTQAIDSDTARRALATALVIFAGEIGATVVAEGVETQEEILTLRRAGIHRAQGFALARPAPLPLAPVTYEPLPIGDLLDLPGAEPETVPWAGLDATMAVTAHGLLASVAAVEGALALLERRPEAMDEDHYRALVGTAQRQARHVGDAFRDMARGLPPELLSFFDSTDPTHPSAGGATEVDPVHEIPALSPTPPLQSSEQTTDLVLDALDDVVNVLRENERRTETALARAASVRHQRLKGESYSAIVDGEDEPLLVTLLAEGQRRLTHVGAGLRRAKARALYSEGKTMEEIAELFSVTRQRISVLLSSPSDKPR